MMNVATSKMNDNSTNLLNVRSNHDQGIDKGLGHVNDHKKKNKETKIMDCGFLDEKEEFHPNNEREASVDLLVRDNRRLRNKVNTLRKRLLHQRLECERLFKASETLGARVNVMEGAIKAFDKAATATTGQGEAAATTTTTRGGKAEARAAKAVLATRQPQTDGRKGGGVASARPCVNRTRTNMLIKAIGLSWKEEQKQRNIHLKGGGKQEGAAAKEGADPFSFFPVSPTSVTDFDAAMMTRDPSNARFFAKENDDNTAQ